MTDQGSTWYPLNLCLIKDPPLTDQGSTTVPSFNLRLIKDPQQYPLNLWLIKDPHIAQPLTDQLYTTVPFEPLTDQGSTTVPSFNL